MKVWSGDEDRWTASVQREAWRLRTRTNDWRRLNVTVIDAPIAHTTPAVARTGPRLLTEGC